MAEGKWIDGLRESTTVADAARAVLGVRLNAVQHYLPKAASEAEKDIEFVHQLRVSSRRAGAALRIFRDLIPKKIRKQLRRALKKVRRSAGGARDWDVFLTEISHRRGQLDSSHHAGLDVLIGLGNGMRMEAQQHLVEAAQEVELRPLIADALDSVHTPDYLDSSSNLRDLAIPQLGEMLADLDRAASGDLADYEHLHQVRIIGKRLRYAMEIFASCFGPEFREQTYSAVEEMQEMLGIANDSFVAIRRLETISAWITNTQPDAWEWYRTGIETLLSFHRERLPEQRRRFEEWWPSWRRTGADFALLLLLTAQKQPGEDFNATG